MASAKETMAAVSTGKTLERAQDTLQALIGRADVKRRFEEIMGKRSASFMSSIISAANANEMLKTADPKTILSAAVMAATLDLPINQSLGFAYLVPYRDNKSGVTRCQFQMGWRGFVQLAMRTGQYRTMNAAEVYEGQLKSFNPFTGEIDFDVNGKKSETVVGYVAFFRLLNGFEKYSFMTRDSVEAHAMRYSKSYDKGFGPWKTNFDSMGLKTVLKLLLSKYGILSIEMQRAIGADQGVIKDVDTAQNTESLPEVDFIDRDGDGDNGTAQEPENGSVE